MPEATETTVDTIVQVDLRGTATVGVKIPADVMKYFSIPAPTGTAEEQKVITREPYSRRVYKDLNDLTGEVVTVKGSTWETPGKVAKKAIGVAVRIPTELKTVKGHTRYVTVRFPSRATVGDISNFLFEKCVTRKPGHFYHNRTMYPVLKKKDVGREPTSEPGEVT